MTQLCFCGITLVRSLSSPCYDLLRLSFSLWCSSSSQGFSAAGCPQGEMTALISGVSGFPWLPRRARQLEGGEESVPGEWLRWESWSLETPVPLSLSPLSTPSCSCLSLGRYTRSPSRYDRSNNSYQCGSRHQWFNGMVQPGQLNLEPEYPNLEILDLDLRNL